MLRLPIAVALLALASSIGAAAASSSSSSSSGSSSSSPSAPSTSSVPEVGSPDATQRCFPDGFLFGSATAAYQVEGGWNATGRTPSIWDDFCREKKDYECANVADDFVHRYKEDIDLMVETGLSSFRFSVSWSRVMNWDNSTKRMKPNAAGIAFYHDVIDTLRAKHVVPILTLYHWDLPSELHTQLSPPGWLNKDIADHFVEYADLMFQEFGSKINYWATFNEPWTFATQGYGNGIKAPGYKKSATNAYTAAHNTLLAHGYAVQRFRERKSSKTINSEAKIGIVLNADFAYPLDPSNAQDVAAADRKMQFALGWFLTPIVSGDYPTVMRERVGDRLPTFTADEAAIVKGSYDALMLNHYSSKTVVDCASPQSRAKCSKQMLGWDKDLGVDDSRLPPGARHGSKDKKGELLCDWFTGFPQGYLDTIRWMHKHDPTAPILLTENGWCGNDEINNQDQLWYFQRYLEKVHIAITEEKIPIIGYTAWSFVDNYEWGSFKPRFGLYYVNFTSQTGSKNGYEPKPTDLQRIPRPAATWYATVAKSKCMSLGPEPPMVLEHDDYDDFFPTLGRVLSNLVVATVLVPLAIAAIAAFFILRRRSALHTAHATETTPLL
jgi:beta-glucosidase/6-phospho-beta-glucosidase/beta-galactosidase